MKTFECKKGSVHQVPGQHLLHLRKWNEFSQVPKKIFGKLAKNQATNFKYENNIMIMKIKIKFKSKDQNKNKKKSMGHIRQKYLIF